LAWVCFSVCTAPTLSIIVILCFDIEILVLLARQG